MNQYNGFTGMGYGVGTMPSGQNGAAMTAGPGLTANIGIGGGLGTSGATAGPVVLLLILGGLAVLYWTTRGIQGSV